MPRDDAVTQEHTCEAFGISASHKQPMISALIALMLLHTREGIWKCHPCHHPFSFCQCDNWLRQQLQQIQIQRQLHHPSLRDDVILSDFETASAKTKKLFLP